MFFELLGTEIRILFSILHIFSALEKLKYKIATTEFKHVEYIFFSIKASKAGLIIVEQKKKEVLNTRILIEFFQFRFQVLQNLLKSLHRIVIR